MSSRLQVQKIYSVLKNTMKTTSSPYWSIWPFCMVDLDLYRDTIVIWQFLLQLNIRTFRSSSQKTTSRANYVYPCPAGHFGITVFKNTISGYLYAWGSCIENQFTRIPRTGKKSFLIQFVMFRFEIFRIRFSVISLVLYRCILPPILQ